MSTRTERLLFWTPRVLGVLFAGFVSLFALDVFGEGYGFWGTMLALVMHLVPTAIVLLALAIAWRWELVGSTLFDALGVAYILMTRGRFPWTTYLVMSGPLFLISLLFQLNWAYRRQLRNG